ncbi:unnamed protein product [Acanthoscelides obtectus]|uniref:Uncharacterized protein n=1 Tax=Acanthoscelides obtectus TaxID=200917 RepID=A0A9P0KHU9_ACAOB|nr:unnamed protein product [Acanthoscelides obtectus]CAK1685456.1 hypothetical protein AOBTE_LOCUS35421 [Acanthoscelides obtectus]
MTDKLPPVLHQQFLHEFIQTGFFRIILIMFCSVYINEHIDGLSYNTQCNQPAKNSCWKKFRRFRRGFRKEKYALI